MLRRHLKKGGAPVATCAGFDFDIASAYLEDALVKAERVGYESHLAGCVTCRRHLIELSRLAPAVPHTVTTPALVADQIPTQALARTRWREVVVGWFNLLGWNLKWQMIGAAGAVLATLIVALSLQSWRQEYKQADDAIALNAIPSASTESQVQTPAPASSTLSPTPSMDNAQSYVAGNSVPVDQKSVRASVPEPPAVGPKGGEANVAVEASSELKLNSPHPSGALQFSFSARQDASAEAQRGSVELPQTPPAQPMLAADSANVARQVLAKEQEIASPVLAERDETRGNDITARMTPPPGINPMNSERLRSRGRPQAEKPSVPSRLYEIASAFARKDKSNGSGRKAALEPLDDESFKPLVVRIRDRVFRFEKDMWIDQAYKPEMQWRVLKLTRGGKQYEQALSDDPLLKEFFDHGPMIIVWKDKIYKVR